MKKLLGIIVIAVITLLLASCSLFKYDVNGTGEYKTETFHFEDADEFEFKDIYVKYNSVRYLPSISMYPSTEKKVEIYTDTGIFEHISVTAINSKIKIRADKNETYVTEYFQVKIYGYSFEEINISSAKVGTLAYSADNLSLDLSGAAICEPAAIVCKNFNLELSGASSFVSGIMVSYMNVDLSGASYVELSGTAGDFVVDMSGASLLIAKNLVSNDVEVDISGASTMSVTFINTLVGEISGASSLTYNGHEDNVDIDLSGTSSISKM